MLCGNDDPPIVPMTFPAAPNQAAASQAAAPIGSRALACLLLQEEIRTNPLKFRGSSSEKQEMAGQSRRIGSDFGIGEASDKHVRGEIKGYMFLICSIQTFDPKCRSRNRFGNVRGTN